MLERAACIAIAVQTGRTHRVWAMGSTFLGYNLLSGYACKLCMCTLDAASS